MMKIIVDRHIQVLFHFPVPFLVRAQDLFSLITMLTAWVQRVRLFNVK